MDSILTSIKKLLGIEEEYEQFDTDIIIFINSTLVTLRQIGVGPKEGFKITSKEETWTDFLGEGQDYEEAKTYVYMKVRIMFDPPINSSVMESLERTASEYESRLNYTAEAKLSEEE